MHAGAAWLRGLSALLPAAALPGFRFKGSVPFRTSQPAEPAPLRLKCQCAGGGLRSQLRCSNFLDQGTIGNPRCCFLASPPPKSPGVADQHVHALRMAAQGPQDGWKRPPGASCPTKPAGRTRAWMPESPRRFRGHAETTPFRPRRRTIPEEIQAKIDAVQALKEGATWPPPLEQKDSLGRESAIAFAVTADTPD